MMTIKNRKCRFCKQGECLLFKISEFMVESHCLQCKECHQCDFITEEEYNDRELYYNKNND